MAACDCLEVSYVHTQISQYQKVVWKWHGFYKENCGYADRDWLGFVVNNDDKEWFSL